MDISQDCSEAASALFISGSECGFGARSVHGRFTGKAKPRSGSEMGKDHVEPEQVQAAGGC